MCLSPNETTLSGQPARECFRSSIERLIKPYRVHVEIFSLKEPAEERGRFIRDADDLIRCLTIEFEVELGLGSTVVPVGKKFELAPPQVCRAIPRFFVIALAEVTTPLAMRPGPPSFSLAKTKIVSPLAMCLPPYIVFCALNANVSDRGSFTSALIANIMLLASHH